ncbi:MAG: DNA/RNA nuclease SfsA [Dehalococcoidia bacterium]
MYFPISGSGRFCFLELKSVTIVRQGRAVFPDAPTLRGGGTSQRPRRRGYPAMPIALE